MGVAAERKRRFLEQNPNCCFCGGDTPARTIDHIPARTFFSNRQWPESFAFPACESCNSASKDSENLCAMIAKVARVQPSPYSQAEVRTALEAMHRSYPDIMDAISSGETLREYYRAGSGGTPPPGEIDQDSVVVTFPEYVNESVESFFLKLSIAMYYKHLDSIFTKSGYYFIWWFTNKVVLDGGLPSAIRTMFPNVSALSRGNTSLEEYFSYAWGQNVDEQIFGFVSVFGDSFGAVSVLKTTPPSSQVIPWKRFSETTKK